MRRRRFQFGLRQVLLITAMLAILFAWIGARIGARQDKHREAHREELRRLESTRAAWLLELNETTNRRLGLIDPMIAERRQQLHDLDGAL
jgi:hypothetical protein